MKHSKTIFMYEHLYELLKKVGATSYGWLLALLGTTFNFFAPEKYAFTLVLVAIIIDAIFGIMVAVKLDKFVLSKLGRVTFFKITSYFSALIVLYMIEKLMHDQGFIGIKVAAGWAAACELWSMSAHVLILKPDATFFRLVRKQLKGEIAAKLGDPLDDVFKEEDKDPQN